MKISTIGGPVFLSTFSGEVACPLAPSVTPLLRSCEKFSQTAVVVLKNSFRN